MFILYPYVTVHFTGHYYVLAKGTKIDTRMRTISELHPAMKYLVYDVWGGYISSFPQALK